MKPFQSVTSPDVVDVLHQEHEQIRHLCADVRGAGRDRKKPLLAALEQAFRLHQLGEVGVAHPAVRNSGLDADTIALAVQANGEQLERSLTEISVLGVGHPDFDSRFEALSGALLDHGVRQERDEFPLLRRYVSTQRLHMMAGALHDVRAMALD